MFFFNGRYVFFLENSFVLVLSNCRQNFGMQYGFLYLHEFKTVLDGEEMVNELVDMAAPFLVFGRRSGFYVSVDRRKRDRGFLTRVIYIRCRRTRRGTTVTSHGVTKCFPLSRTERHRFHRTVWRNTKCYIPASGGEPLRLTIRDKPARRHGRPHGPNNIVMGWTPTQPLCTGTNREAFR
jgi:hypothetical protein